MRGIGWAVSMMRDGLKVRRAGWNGKGMWLFLSANEPFEVAASGFKAKAAADYAMSQGGTAKVLPFVVMRTGDGSLVPWLCSQTDLLAEDWEIAS